MQNSTRCKLAYLRNCSHVQVQRLCNIEGHVTKARNHGAFTCTYCAGTAPRAARAYRRLDFFGNPPLVGLAALMCRRTRLGISSSDA